MGKLVQGMTGLAFANAINENAEALGTTGKLKFEEMTAEHLRNTLNEQLTEAGSDRLVTFETEKVAEVYNEEVGAVLESDEEPELPENPEGEDLTGDEGEDENPETTGEDELDNGEEE